MNLKAQGALEYLLLIGGAILIAAIALTVLGGLGSKGGATVEKGVWTSQCAALGQQFCGDSQYNEFGSSAEGYCNSPVADCTWDTTSQSCKPNFTCA